MSIELPYMNSTGTLPKVLNKIVEASVPESFNYDFLGTKLGFPGGNQRTFIRWAKQCGFLTPDGTPTQLYKNFRNPDMRGVAMANALKTGYKELFTRNAYAQDLSNKDLTQLVSEITGNPHDSSTVKLIVRSFSNAKDFADFEAKNNDVATNKPKPKSNKPETSIDQPLSQIDKSSSVKLGLNYTINLVLPKTDDPAIFDAIFKSLKENLLDE
ncbi:DUF5343 domain-containing protein [Sunxiuqinia elliptica]|uniref:DUF5343 domain-containing protein n=1 Tax=Sunxiuqinia elliptica TaxID=655355 RepID=A0A4R6GUA1_9BACT|nr:DUF5343 domain-containing protein [Sunxiuqinia elliptica]TDN98883.1 hypothetical protein DET52_10710 [Sunxiuqinia elliptica]TDO56324.1 hypothetical protein DET65_3874 [Sunxiuqinia elliptica]